MDTPVILALGSPRQEYRQFEVMLGFIVNSRPYWATYQALYQKKKKEKKRKKGW
jgi:hypothetical protein